MSGVDHLGYLKYDSLLFGVFHRFLVPSVLSSGSNKFLVRSAVFLLTKKGVSRVRLNGTEPMSLFLGPTHYVEVNFQTNKNCKCPETYS